MAIRKIVALGGPKEGVLRAKAKKVSRFDEHLERLIADMWETMRAAPGVGLAAPQVGESIRVLVAQYEENAVSLVNPEIIKRSEEMALGTEGCLSIPGIVGDNVERHEAVVVKARNPKGKEIRVRADGWFARVLQHEIDHLDGVLFIDRIKPEDIREVTEEDVEASAEGAQPSASANGKNGKSAKNGKAGSTTKTGAAAKTASAARVKANGTVSGRTASSKPAPLAGAKKPAKSAAARTQGGAQ